MADYNSTATSTVYVNGKPAEQELQRLKQRASDLQDAMAKAASAGNKADLKKFRSELTSTRREIKNVENSMHSAEIVMNRLNKATPRELNMALRQLKKELNDIERGSDAWNKQVAKIKRVKAELDSVNAEMREQQSVLSRLNDGFNRWGMSIASAAAALTGITMTVRQAVDAYASMDQEMANVQKYTGMGKDQVAALNDEFKKMDTRTPREGLNQLAQEAGKLGKTSQEDIMGFVRAADKIDVALDELGDGATLTLSKLTGVFGDEERLGTERSLLAVGSVINELSQNSRASAPYLAEFTSRLGGIGSQAGMTIQQVMGFGAVLDSAGQQVESSATALGQVITRLYKDPAKYAKAAGMDVQQFTDLLKTDANAAVIQFLETLNQAGNLDVLAPMFADMGENGARAIATLTTLAKHIDEVKQQQQAANVAFSEATSIDKEYDVQNNTIQAGLEKAKNQFHELAVALGEKLIPVARFAISGTSAMMRVLSGVIGFVYKYKGSIVTLTATLAAYTIAVNYEIIAVRAMIIGEKLAAAAKAAHNAITGTAAILSNALAASYYTLTGNTLKAAAAQKALTAAMATTPWGAVIAVVGTLVTLIAAFATSTDKAAKKTKALDSATQHLTWSESEHCKSLSEEKSRIEALVKVAEDERASKEARQRAINELNRICPAYNGLLAKEGSLYRSNKKALDDYLSSLERRMRMAYYKDEYEKYLRAEEEAKANLIRAELVRDDAAGGSNSSSSSYFVNKNGERVYVNINTAVTREAMRYGIPSNQVQYLNTPVGQTQKVVEMRQSQYNAAVKDRQMWERIMTKAGFSPAEVLTSSDPKDPGVAPGPGGVGGGGGGGGSRHGGGGGSSRGGSSTPTDIFAAEKRWREDAENRLKLAYAKRQISLDEYTLGMYGVEIDFYERQLKHTQLSNEQRLAIQAQQEEAERKLKEYYNKVDVEAEERDHKMRVADLKQQYLDGKKTQEEYNAEMQKLEEERLRNLAAIYERQANSTVVMWEEARKGAEKRLNAILNGNVSLSGREAIDAYKMTQAGWAGFAESEGLATVGVHTKEYSVKGADKKNHTVVVTPILPDGTVLSEKDLDAYVKSTLTGASDFSAVDSKGIVVAVDAKKEDADELAELLTLYFSPNPGLDAEAFSKYLDAEDKIRDMFIKQMEEKRDKEENERQKHIQELERLKDEYFGLNDQEKQELYDNTVKLLDKVYQQELAKLGDNEKAKLELEKKYAEAKKKLHDKIYEEEDQKQEERNKNWDQWTKTLLDKMFGKGTWEKYGGFITSAVSSISASWQNLTKLVEAEEQAKLAAMTKKYDAEIKAAEGNKYRVEQLEKKKAAEEKRIKDAANKRAMAMEMAQAISSNALGAINAYASAAKAPWPLGMVLGPIAAGLALSAGLIQIAAIRKQHQVQSQGYSEGGYTRPGAKDEPAGIVHAGEWVASQKLLASPVARPMIEFLDHAQRTNTIGRLAMPSSPIRSGASSVLAPAQPVVVTESQDLRDTIRQLNKRLNEPFVTINTVAGDHGIKQAQDEYKKLMNNTLPKNKRT